MFFGAERSLDGSHVLVLGDDNGQRSLCGTASAMDGPAPADAVNCGCVVTILALPERHLAAAAGSAVEGMELVDAAPRGLGQLDRERNGILRAATEHGLVLLAGSNNHGWGRTVAAWNVMRIPGWREMTRPELESAILRQLADRRAGAVEVVERRRPWTGASVTALAFTAPAVAVYVLRTLSVPERFSCLFWVWGTFGLVALVARSRAALTRSSPGVVGAWNAVR